jgi:hypothetical protein
MPGHFISPLRNRRIVPLHMPERRAISVYGHPVLSAISSTADTACAIVSIIFASKGYL